jgi:hypothetical protein
MCNGIEQKGFDMTKPIRADYDRVCAECVFSELMPKSDILRCWRGRDIVTGKPLFVTCRANREMRGNCRPNGIFFKPREKGPIAAE